MILKKNKKLFYTIKYSKICRIIASRERLNCIVKKTSLVRKSMKKSWEVLKKLKIVEIID